MSLWQPPIAGPGDGRLDYDAPPLEESQVPPVPLPLMRQWLAEAAAAGLVEPTAMVLGTVDAAGSVTQRTVLLKAMDAAGPVFFTNRRSRKGRAIGAAPDVSALFPWHAMHRQLIVLGTAVELDDAASDTYFRTRPRGSQIAAWASEQSQPAAGRGDIERAWQEAAARFDGVEVPRPPHWGGYRVQCREVEFWAGRRSRMHDRLVFATTDGAPAPLDDVARWQVLRRFP